MARGRLAIVLAILTALLVALGLLASRKQLNQAPRQIAQQPTSTQPQPSPTLDPPRLPDMIDQESLVGRRVGPMRFYLAVQNETPLKKNDGQPLEKVPILVVIENDTYQTQNWPEGASKSEDELFSVTVWSESDQKPPTSFTYHQKVGEANTWAPSERRSFTVPWYVHSPLAGWYLISVKLAGGTTLRLHARLAK